MNKDQIFGMVNKQLETRLIELPEIVAGRNLIQNEYHLHDVFNHTLAVVEHLKTLGAGDNLLATGYLHDIGKPVVARPRYYGQIQQFDDEGRPRNTFPNHEVVGARMVRNLSPELFEQFRLNQEKIALLVENHYEPMKYIERLRATRNPQDFLKLFEQTRKDLVNRGIPLKDLMDLFAADTIGKGDTWGDAKELLKFREALLGIVHPLEVYKMQAIQGGIKYGYKIKE
jgi:hypothetical protein